MEVTQLRWRWTITAALLGFLSLILLIPGASALHCHSHASYQEISGGRVKTEFSVSSRNLRNCSANETACVEAHLMLSTEKMDLLVTHRGCANEGLNKTVYDNSSNHHLSIHSSVLYCHSDFCNMNLTDLSVFKMPRQDKAPEASSSNRCYSGITQNPDTEILGRVTCGRDYTQCYQGNATITAGFLGVDFVIKTCQQPSYNVTESQSFGPIEVKLSGSCCHGMFCNGKVAAPDYKDIKTITMSPWNPFFSHEDNEDDHPKILVEFSRSDTLNPKPSLQFYLLVVALGIALLVTW